MTQSESGVREKKSSGTIEKKVMQVPRVVHGRFRISL